MLAFSKRALLPLAVLLALFLLNSCGSSSYTGTGSSNTNKTNTSNKETSKGYSQGNATPTTQGGSLAVKTATATVAGKPETILTNVKGMTLYYFTPDTSQKTACTTGCTSTWPPLLLSSGGTVAADTKLPGTLEVYKNDNGQQVTYNDHPLYTYVADTAPGQINGQGIGGKWFVATPDLAKNK